jgi:ribosomal protein S11
MVVPVLAVIGRVAATAGEIGLAGARPASPPLAAMAATATAAALRAMVNRNVDVRFSDRERYKVNFRPGTHPRAQLPPVFAWP